MQTWEELHYIFRHVHQKALEKLVKENPTELSIKVSRKDFTCKACIEGKMTKAPFPQVSKTTYENIGELIVMDLWGKALTRSLQGSKYFMTFTDMHSRMTVLY